MYFPLDFCRDLTVSISLRCFSEGVLGVLRVLGVLGVVGGTGDVWLVKRSAAVCVSIFVDTTRSFFLCDEVEAMETCVGATVGTSLEGEQEEAS